MVMNRAEWERLDVRKASLENLLSSGDVGVAEQISFVEAKQRALWNTWQTDLKLMNELVADLEELEESKEMEIVKLRSQKSICEVDHDNDNFNDNDTGSGELLMPWKMMEEEEKGKHSNSKNRFHLHRPHMHKMHMPHLHLNIPHFHLPKMHRKGRRTSTAIKQEIGSQQMLQLSLWREMENKKGEEPSSPSHDDKVWRSWEAQNQSLKDELAEALEHEKEGEMREEMKDVLYGSNIDSLEGENKKLKGEIVEQMRVAEVGQQQLFKSWKTEAEELEKLMKANEKVKVKDAIPIPNPIPLNMAEKKSHHLHSPFHLRDRFQKFTKTSATTGGEKEEEEEEEEGEEGEEKDDVDDDSSVDLELELSLSLSSELPSSEVDSSLEAELQQLDASREAQSKLFQAEKDRLLNSIEEEKNQKTKTETETPAEKAVRRKRARLLLDKLKELQERNRLAVQEFGRRRGELWGRILALGGGGGKKRNGGGGGEEGKWKNLKFFHKKQAEKVEQVEIALAAKPKGEANAKAKAKVLAKTRKNLPVPASIKATMAEFQKDVRRRRRRVRKGRRRTTSTTTLR